jgi:hypothetical protein
MSGSQSPKLSRRNFLLAVGAGGAATAAAVVSRTAPVTQPAPAGDDKRRGKGYQDSAHVRSYYRTTKV